ncbi:MAG: hypothetical protein ABFC88_12650 [Thermoguttaceae bacterium]
MTTIKEIYLDMDDVLNTLGPFALHTVGCDFPPDDYTNYPTEYGYNVHDIANDMLGEKLYTCATFWASIPRRLWVKVPETPYMPWLLETCANLVGSNEVMIATSPTKDPDCLAGKVEWILDHCPAWLQRQYSITPRKFKYARPGALLIDDHPDNVWRWRERGGPAILVPRPWNKLWPADPQKHIRKELERLLQKTGRALISL